MGDLAFAKSFNLLESGELHFAVDLLTKGLPVQGAFIPATWGFLIFKSLPVVAGEWNKLVSWCQKQILLRMKVRSSGIGCQLVLNDNI